MKQPTEYPVPISHGHVMSAINGERQYQIEKWGGAAGADGTHTVGDFILYTEDYLDEAIAHAEVGNDMESLHTIRKVTALLCACLERHEYRGFTDPRVKIFEMLEMETDIVNRLPNDKVLTSNDLRDDLASAMRQMKKVRFAAARTFGDTETLQAAAELLRATYSLMRYYRAPTRGATTKWVSENVTRDAIASPQQAEAASPTPPGKKLTCLNLMTEQWREYRWEDPATGKVCVTLIMLPDEVYLYKGCSTHRVVHRRDGHKVVSIVPAIGIYGCVVTSQPKTGQPAVVC